MHGSVGRFVVKKEMAKINVQDRVIHVIQIGSTDYISLTDIASSATDGSAIIAKWISNKNTLEYLSVWERIHNEKFNYTEFGVIERESGVNRFSMSIGQWIARTQAIGLLAKSGRYGGSYAHQDIAFHFAMWLSPVFQIYLTKEYQRLKLEEHQNLQWNARRELAKVNYHIHTAAIQEHLIPLVLNKQQIHATYASEADLLNVALFGMTAQQWREQHLKAEGNIRDYATVNQLICLSNLENINALLIQEGKAQSDRLVKLNEMAIHQMRILLRGK